MTSEELARVELKAFQDLKVEICASRGGPDDCMPLLSVTFADRVHVIVGLEGAHPVDMIQEAVAVVHKEMGSEHGAITHLSLSSEGYLKVAPVGTNLEDYPRGRLVKDFTADPNSGVREALIITVYTPAAETVALAQCTYIYDDHGQPVFDTVDCLTSQYDGAVLGMSFVAMKRALG